MFTWHGVTYCIISKAPLSVGSTAIQVAMIWQVIRMESKCSTINCCQAFLMATSEIIYIQIGNPIIVVIAVATKSQILMTMCNV